ncbi:MAG: Asp-tRNA(Asn)/Glu-tRNA(Gln) amidotransferase GatCAB subunit B [Bacteroidetes bacterium QS_7_67_15]|nr:MAG: Asp-tRNA(Asn)/Glu-tRNA(Gln) amidotransferase GatCAB subunit B [Bacteroidetes bacterium QS_7_67_15]
MSPDGYERIEPVIGLEVHCQLRTEAKLFSSAPAQPDAGDGANGNQRERPNTRTQPFDLGHPGTLPVLNERALVLALRLGLATGCRVAQRSSFSRKHYFYPDLAKGYQIRRLNLEEDAGKSLHSRKRRATRVDYNRAGAALVELVTEPDLRSPHEAARFMKKIRRLVRYLGVSDGRMEAGSLRCDANVSLRERGGDALGARVEIKNLNSFRHLERALRFEAARQARRIENGASVPPETRRWDEEAEQTRLLRKKETAPDYRYLPEPDLPPVVVGEELLDRVRASMPEQPEERKARFVEDIGLPERAAALLTEDRALADFYEDAVSRLYKLTGGGNTRRQARRAAHFLLNEGRRALAEHRAPIDALPVEPTDAAEVVYLILEDDLDESAARKVFAALLAGRDDDPETIAREEELLQVAGRDELKPIVEKTLDRHSKNVHRYKSGKKSLIGFFIGEVRSAFDEEGAPDPKLIREMIEDRLD